MKNTKFVFESFQEFVNFAEKAIYEAEGSNLDNIEQLQIFLGLNGLDDTGRKSLSLVDELARKSNVEDFDVMNGFNKASLSGIISTIKKMTKKDTTEITSIAVESADVEYDNLSAGEILNEKGKRVLLTDFLTTVNQKNLRTLLKSPNLNAEKKRFTQDPDGDVDKEFQKGSGPLRQYVCVSNKGKLDFKIYTGDNPVNKWVAEPTLPGAKAPTKYKEALRNEEAGKISTAFFVYYPTKIESGAGQPYSATEITQFTRPVSKKSVRLAPIILENNEVLFEVSKSVLREEGKAMILNALGNIAAAKTILITGGASKEGDRKFNEQLCKARAQSVADFLKSTSFKNADIKVADVADIQPADSKDPLEKWRRVKFEIEGETLVPQETKEEEIVYQLKDTPGNVDKVTIKQVAIVMSSKFI